MTNHDLDRQEREEAIAREILADAAPHLLAVVRAFVDWAENHASMFVWARDVRYGLDADEGWMALMADAEDAIAKAEGRP